MAKKENPRDSIVSARLTDHEHELVKADAERRRMSVTDYLRKAILQEREGSSKTRLAEIETRLAEQDQTIFQLVNALTDLRETVAKGVRAILLAGEPDEEKRKTIRRWVQENLLPEDLDPPEERGSE